MNPSSARSAGAFILAPLLLILLTGIGFVATPADAADPTTASDATIGLAEIAGSGTQQLGRWKRYPVTVPHDARIEITAHWETSADVNIFLIDESNDRLAYANSTDSRPEVITHDVPAGDYDIAVLVKTGQATYDVDVRVSPPAPVAVVEGSGDQDAGRWQTFPVVIDDPGDLKIIGDWNGDANVNLFLRTVGKQTLTYANQFEQPEVLTHVAAAGTYELAVLVKSGAAAYRVEVYNSPYAPTTLTGTPPELPEPTWTADYPGQPQPGTVGWGAAWGSNGDPTVRHEEPAGAMLSVRRTFFQWRHRTGYLLDTARSDLEVGRLPWVSIKTPSWSSMAAGDHDAAIDELLSGLDSLDGAVWLTVHHEPDGGGGNNFPDDAAGPAGHLAMNKQVRERMTALGTDNIALAPVLMSWTWDSRSGRNPDEWWAPGVYDFLGIDHYVRNEAPLVNSRWDLIRRWADVRDVEIAVGEWGVQGSDAAAGAHVREWYESAIASHDDGGGARVVSLAAYDKQHDPGQLDWELKGDQLRVFHELLRDPRTARIAQD